MKLGEIKKLIGAEILAGEDKLSVLEIDTACGADLMSDVLAFTHENTLLCTGLTSAQVVRTAEVAGLSGIIFVRGKRPSDDVIALARERGIPLMATCLPLFETCGVLYGAGISGTYIREQHGPSPASGV
ncbi:MAG: DRTGG domain-containing protein [Clostridia bacterium]|nr:DRTGG domain-containing protein [Clostridia bacterium]